MRIRVVALVASGALVVAGLAAAMTVPKMKGSITSGGSISLKTSKGKTAKLLKAGKYTFTVRDTATSHNFTLDGPGISDKTITGTSFTGTKSVTVNLSKAGNYKVYCTLHPYIVQRFKVK
jgi:plastocyanin